MSIKVNILSGITNFNFALEKYARKLARKSRSRGNKAYDELETVVGKELRVLDAKLTSTYKMCDELIQDARDLAGNMKNHAIEDTIKKQKKLKGKL